MLWFLKCELLSASFCRAGTLLRTERPPQQQPNAKKFFRAGANCNNSLPLYCGAALPLSLAKDSCLEGFALRK